MKVIFLDIDGVLNDAITTADLMDDSPKKEHLDCLKQIVDATGAEIVLSSTWRLFPLSRREIKKSLATVGLDFIDRTDELDDGRGAEIDAWLCKHPEVENFVILDDEDRDMKGEFADHIVRTSFYTGLLPEHVEKAIKILNKEVA